MQEEGWPSRRLKRWPIAPNWEPQKPKKRISPLGYQKVVGAVRALFTDPALGEVVLGFQDYAFQQGGSSNANPRDRAFFFDILVHDMVFFKGDKGHPVLEDMPIEAKVYDALPHMEASYFDLYRVTSRGMLGGVELESVLTGTKLKAGVRVFKGPKQGECILGRVVRIGRGLFLDEPYLKIAETDLGAIKGRFNEELRVTGKRVKGLNAKGLLKVAAYHLYEECVGLEMARELRARLEGLARFAPTIARWRVRKRRQLPDLGRLEGAQVAEEDEESGASIVTIDLAPGADIHLNLRQAMVMLEERELICLTYLESGRAALWREIEALLPSSAIFEHEALTSTLLYRSLRHTLKA